MFSFVMYLIVRKSLGLSPGKTAAQAGHAVDMLCQKYQEIDRRLITLEGKDKTEDEIKSALGNDYLVLSNFIAWRNDGRTKIVLAADEEQWLGLKQLPHCVVVRDAGRTEIEPGTETVIGLPPLLKSAAPPLIKELKLLK